MSTEQNNAQINESQPLISFIITTYNLPLEYLMQCVKSITVLSLRTVEREIILIDDGTEVAQINDLLDFRDDIIYVRQPNKGPSVARNLGIKVSSGKYIQFVDGDDMIIGVPYEHCLDIVRFRAPDLVLFNETASTKVETPFMFDGPMNGNVYMRDNNLKSSPCRYIFQKTILDDLRFTPNRYHEDEEFTPQLIIKAKKMFVTNSDAYFYRQHADSRNNDLAHKYDRLQDIEKILFHLQTLAKTLSGIDALAMQRRIDQLAMDYLYNTIKLTHSKKQLITAIEHLRFHGLYPLPDKNYTKKYNLFRKAVGSNIGRNMLIWFIK